MSTIFSAPPADRNQDAEPSLLNFFGFRLVDENTQEYRPDEGDRLVERLIQEPIKEQWRVLDLITDDAVEGRVDRCLDDYLFNEIQDHIVGQVSAQITLVNGEFRLSNGNSIALNFWEQEVVFNRNGNRIHASVRQLFAALSLLDHTGIYTTMRRHYFVQLIVEMGGVVEVPRYQNIEDIRNQARGLFNQEMLDSNSRMSFLENGLPQEDQRFFRMNNVLNRLVNFPNR